MGASFQLAVLAFVCWTVHSQTVVVINLLTITFTKDLNSICTSNGSNLCNGDEFVEIKFDYAIEMGNYSRQKLIIPAREILCNKANYSVVNFPHNKTEIEITGEANTFSNPAKISGPNTSDIKFTLSFLQVCRNTTISKKPTSITIEKKILGTNSGTFFEIEDRNPVKLEYMLTVYKELNVAPPESTAQTMDHSIKPDQVGNSFESENRNNDKLDYKVYKELKYAPPASASQTMDHNIKPDQAATTHLAVVSVLVFLTVVLIAALLLVIFYHIRTLTRIRLTSKPDYDPQPYKNSVVIKESEQDILGKPFVTILPSLPVAAELNGLSKKEPAYSVVKKHRQMPIKVDTGDEDNEPGYEALPLLRATDTNAQPHDSHAD